MVPTNGLTTLQRQSIADRVGDELRRLIISGTLKPGQPLNEADVAEQLGVSRSPVRAALQRLVAERLLVAEPHKSVTVKEFTEDDIAEIYDARLAIETHAATSVISAGQEPVERAAQLLQDALQAIPRALVTGDRLKIVEADLCFHRQLVSCGGNHRLAEAYGLLSAETITCMTWLEVARPSGDELEQEHQVLIDALKGEDPGEMSRVIAHHLTGASHRLSACSPAERSQPNGATAVTWIRRSS